MKKNNLGKFIAVAALLIAFVVLSLVLPGQHNLKCGECDGTGMTDAAVCEACAGSGVGEEPADSNYYSTVMALAPPIIAIVLALVTKEVYSSLFIGVLSGAVCGDHCSPISDTTIMASAGAQCNHVNHVSTQLPYALTVAGVSVVAYILAGFIQNWMIVLPIAIVLMVATLFVIKAATNKKAPKA
jgi:hypothetical protein